MARTTTSRPKKKPVTPPPSPPTPSTASARNELRVPTPSASRGLFTHADVDKVDALGTTTDAPGNVRLDGVDALSDPATLAALREDRALFAATEIPIDQVIEVLPQAIELLGLERRATTTQAFVHRHRRKLAVPVADAVSRIHKLIVGTPEGSALRMRYAAFLAAWDASHKGGGGHPSGGGGGGAPPAGSR